MEPGWLARISIPLVLLLLLVHAGLAVWALLGLAEFAGPMPWGRLSNPLFPDWMLWAQWFAILPTATVFLAGWALRWRRMPLALGFGYLAMGSICAWQTTHMLVHDGRWLDMAAEYLAYVLILVFLHRASFVRDHLGMDRA
ncbi:MAG: hypothetical protein VYB54_00485 [Pseudomonadota bacterium]|nr:hypothetical protein [Pseudomonadota bacterium]